MFVQFADSSLTAIIAAFGSPQDETVYPNQGEVTEDDPRYIAFFAASNPVQSVTEINQATRNRLLAAAAIAIAPLQDAVDLEEATTAEQALLKAWKQYRVAVNRFDVSLVSPLWPDPPQSGF